ncbi:MAG: hypothetical protein M3O50_12945 [Myxococcota bacterium]|nr:hypothetical protein [Myxococcota bacterium]
MSGAQRRGARRELEVAKQLGSRRVRRQRFEALPDVEPVRLSDGTMLVAESKTRAKLPRWLVGAIAQARRYLPSAVPLVVLSELGGEPLALLPLRDLARLLGLRPSVGQQLPLSLLPPRAHADADENAARDVAPRARART